MARILLVSYSGYGAWFTLRFQEEGHSVDYYLMDKEYSGVLYNIVKKPLLERPDYSKYDLVLFDLTGKPREATKAAQVTNVIGDSKLATQLEDERLFGIEIMEECGINVPFYEAFDDLQEAKSFIKKTKKRYVFKPDGGQDQDTATTYVSKDWEDLLAYMDELGSHSKGVKFILQEVVGGTELSTEAWFNGKDFYLLNGTLEDKKFMNDNKGPNTGCSSNLVWVYDSQEDPPRIFKDGLGKLKDYLQSVNYRGMIDLNTIVSEHKLYGLEWTPRFGYDASATLFNLIRSNLGDFLCAIGNGDVPYFEIKNTFSGGVRVSIPPYPGEFKGKHPEDIAIKGIDLEKIPKDYYLYDVYMDGDSLCTAGVNGFIGVPLSNGETIQAVFDQIYFHIDKIQVPDMQYRTDACSSLWKRYKTLKDQGWLS